MTRIGGTPLIDLRTADGHAMTRLIQSAAHAPAGVDIILWVSPRAWPPHSALAYLWEHGQHLGSINVMSDTETIKVWVAALRGEAA